MRSILPTGVVRSSEFFAFLVFLTTRPRPFLLRFLFLFWKRVGEVEVVFNPTGVGEGFGIFEAALLRFPFSGLPLHRSSRIFRVFPFAIAMDKWQIPALKWLTTGVLKKTGPSPPHLSVR